MDAPHNHDTSILPPESMNSRNAIYPDDNSKNTTETPPASASVHLPHTTNQADRIKPLFQSNYPSKDGVVSNAHIPFGLNTAVPSSEPTQFDKDDTADLNGVAHTLNGSAPSRSISPPPFVEPSQQAGDEMDLDTPSTSIPVSAPSQPVQVDKNHSVDPNGTDYMPDKSTSSPRSTSPSFVEPIKDGMEIDPPSIPAVVSPQTTRINPPVPPPTPTHNRSSVPRDNISASGIGPDLITPTFSDPEPGSHISALKQCVFQLDLEFFDQPIF